MGLFRLGKQHSSLLPRRKVFKNVGRRVSIKDHRGLSIALHCCCGLELFSASLFQQRMWACTQPVSSACIAILPVAKSTRCAVAVKMFFHNRTK